MTATNAARHQHHAHDERRRREQFLRVADAAGRLRYRVGRITCHERHDRDARLEA
jgi:hypothetical protein